MKKISLSSINFGKLFFGHAKCLQKVFPPVLTAIGQPHLHATNDKNI